MTSRPSRLTVSLAQHLISTGRVKKQELALHCHALAVAGEERWGLNAFTRICSKESVLEQADREGPLAGIPISVKANLAVRDNPLTASSKMLTTESSCGYDAEVVSRLKEAGAIVVGITQMDEFGMGSLGTNLGEGDRKATKNPLPLCNPPSRSLDDWIKQIQMPYDDIVQDHSTAVEAQADELQSQWYTGGSSCGSAASVAHGSSLVSLASDTGGSVRLPAAWCGVAGFKPSYGYLSRKGLVSYASSLDTIGILAPSAECVATTFENLHPKDQEDITDSTMGGPRTSRSVPTEPLNLRVGIPSAFLVDECPQSIQTAWRECAVLLKESGATLVDVPTDLVSPELIRASLAAYYIIASAEASSNLSRYDGFRFGLSTAADKFGEGNYSELERQYAASRSQGFGREALRRILSGTSVLSSDRYHTHYEAAARVRAMVSKQLRKALETVDVILTPTCLSMPYQTNTDPTGMFANDVLTVPVSLACLPAISLPWQDGTPIGLQITGLSEGRVLEVAADLHASLHSS